MTNREKWPPLQRLPAVGEVYLHLNGLAYTILALAIDNQREEVQVIHQGKDGCIWSRPIGNFMGVPEGHGARFRLNQDTDAS